MSFGTRADKRVDGDSRWAIDNSMEIELAAKQLAALGSAPRLLLFRALVRAGRSGISVRNLQEQVGIPSASTLSHHLQRLVAAGLMTQERQSTTLICRTDPEAVRGLVAFLFEERAFEGDGRTHVAPPEASARP